MSTDLDDHPMDTRRNVEINLGKRCNSRCVFCLDGQATAAQRQPIAFEELKREIRRWADLGHRSVGFLGGEPTTYPQLVEGVAYARQQGFSRITVATNGLRLHRPEYADELLAAGLTRVTVSLHSHRAELEDRFTTVVGSFEKKTAAIHHLIRRQGAGALPDGISINMVLNAWNAPHLLQIQKFFLRELQVVDLRINFIRAEGNAEGSRELTPRYARVVSPLMKAVALNETHYRHTLTFGGFPLCVLPQAFLNDEELVRRYFGEYRDLATDCSIRSEGPHGHVAIADQRARFNWQERKRQDLKSPIAVCGRCSAAARCEGVWNAYLELYGDEEFNPL